MSPTNPFDPGTPAAQQAKASLTGVARLPAGFAESTLSEGHAWLFALTAPNDVAFEADLVPTTPAEDGRNRGTFTLDSIPADVYRLEVFVQGASVAPLLVNLPIGGTVDVGELTLDEKGGGFISGTAHLDGAGITSHAGIVVGVPGTSFAAVTGDEGTFRLEVAPGEHTVRATFPGYEPASAEGAVQVGRQL